tara:strand:+ start:725 stop:904 length:180 start_codon:yes stop_codon:yes gene_type:complete
MKNQLINIIKESLNLKDEVVDLYAYFEIFDTKLDSLRAVEKFESVNNNKFIEHYVRNFF